MLKLSGGGVRCSAKLDCEPEEEKNVYACAVLPNV